MEHLESEARHKKIESIAQAAVEDIRDQPHHHRQFSIRKKGGRVRLAGRDAPVFQNHSKASR